jgi:hypothetical protein
MRKHTSIILELQAQPMRGSHASIPWIYDIINPRERASKNQRLPHMHHMDPMAHQSD